MDQTESNDILISIDNLLLQLWTELSFWWISLLSISKMAKPKLVSRSGCATVIAFDPATLAQDQQNRRRQHQLSPGWWGSD
jgi:hypothetical protein